MFLQNSVALDSAFWHGYVPPLPAAAMQQALATAGNGAAADTTLLSSAASAAAPPPTGWGRWADEFSRRLRVSYSVGLLPVQATGGPAELRLAPPGSSFAAQGRANVAGGNRTSVFVGLGYRLELWPGLFA